MTADPLLAQTPAMGVAAPRFSRCRNCWAEEPERELTQLAPGVFYCADCMHACPECGKPIGIDATVCPRCERAARHLVEQVRDALEACDFRRCERTLSSLLKRRPEDPSVQDLLRAYQDKRSLTRERIGQINDALLQRQFFRVGRLMSELDAIGYIRPQIEERKPRVQRHLQQAEAWLSQIDLMIEQTPRAALKACLRALQACPDHPKALSALAEAERQVTALERKEETLMEALRKRMDVFLDSRDALVALRQSLADLQNLSAQLQSRPPLLDEAEERLRAGELALREEMAQLKQARALNRRPLVAGIALLALSVLLALGSLGGTTSDVLAVVVRFDLSDYRGCVSPLVALCFLTGAALLGDRARRALERRRRLDVLARALSFFDGGSEQEKPAAPETNEKEAALSRAADGK
jgi:hypothetical protein